MVSQNEISSLLSCRFGLPVWANETLYRIQDHLERNPYDLDLWAILLDEAAGKRISEVRPLYEHLITIFPGASKYWKFYIEQEIKAENFERAEKLFKRCLLNILNLDLWKMYLTYIKETKRSLPNYPEIMCQAYDFALHKIGIDINSFSIWNDYINFIKGVEAVGWYAKKQKLASLRSLYQRGIKTPITGIDSLWKDYLELEHRQDPIHAEKTRLEFCKSYARPRHVANMFAEKMKGINKNAQSVPPNGSPRERKQVELWWKYIGWEIGNPLRTEDTALYTKRVHFAFEQCLLCMGHHPDVWLRAARHLEFSSKILVEKGDLNASNVVNEQVAHIFGRAIAILNRNMFLYFAYADFEEGRLKYEKVHEIYSKYLDIPGIHPTLAYIQYMKFARRAEGLESARKVFKRARDDPRSQYHIFVYAALMEWHYSTDKNTAFRTLELGFKKFGGIPEYVTSYIDYLSHLNENNNTRQLFEKILSSGRLGNENSIDIWNKFLEFESNVGDLPSIVEVKKRRVEVLSKIKKVEGKATAQLVDKYRFLDLYPGTPKELENIGYSEVINVTGVSGMNTFLGSIIDQAKQIPLPKPDYGQMIPYKPKKNALPGDHPVPGGSFPLPPLAADLCKLLPPPDCFQGPFVHVDKLMDIFNRLHLPEKAPTTTENGFMRFFAIAKSGIRLDESDCRDLRLPPKNDIYRKRQRKN